MSDILDQLNEAALFATNRACTFDGQPDEAGMRDLGYSYGHLHREAFTEIERLRGLLQNLADAADDVGIRHFDTDSMPGSVRRMQDATLAARAALGTADQPAVVPHRCSMELTGLQIQHLHDFCGGDFDCSITVEYFDAAPDDEDGNPMPAGLWAYFTDYPDEGRTFLPATADKPADQPAAVLVDSQDAYYNPIHQVYFRAGLIACREYMARFVEAESPSIAASIRANWWPSLGKDFGPPRLLKWEELTEGEYGEESFRVLTKDEISPTLEALPVALGFLERRAASNSPASQEPGA